MDKFQEMQSFVGVVDSGSFVRAADALKTSKAAISRHVAELEQRLGVRLLNRTTRKLSLTDAGQAFYLRCTDLLGALDEAECEVNARSGQASGLLRISAPVTFGVLHLAPLWGEFLEQHPQVNLEVTLADRTVDLVEDGFDLAIRITRSQQSSLIARKLASTRMIACASPQYLKQHGNPKRPQDLAGHNVISYSYWSSGDAWEFVGPEGPVSVKTRSRLHANSGDTCRAAALQHQGIILQPEFLVYGDLRSGQLRQILPKYRAAEIDILALYPSRRQLPLKLRYLIDFLVQAFDKPVWQE